MRFFGLILILICLAQASDYEFPNEFWFGVASASYQVEGAWNLSGKGENIWDKLTDSNRDHISDRSNGDIACDAYHKIAEDVRILKNFIYLCIEI